MHLDEKTLKKSVLYSEELGIDLRQGTDKELFKWFLASILFGARITETVAKNTYRAFERHRLLGPRKILETGWGFLVNPVMREGGYVRYDGKTSSQVLSNCEKLLKEYGGSLRRLHSHANNNEDLVQMLLAFYGIGPVTTNIFLRELRPFWKKADPDPLPIVNELAKKYGIDLRKYHRKTLTFVRIEAGLLRRRREARRST